MLTEIQAALDDRVGTTWSTEVQAWGRDVKLFRDYEAGRHPQTLTDQMREMLRVPVQSVGALAINYCELVVQAMASRLRVVTVQGDDDAATDWADDVRAESRFDALQMDVHEAAVRDGDSFVMVAYDNARGMPVLTFEPAWDGYVGVIPVYDRYAQQIVAAVKVWWEGGAGSSDRRVNVYFPDRVLKYSLEDHALRMEEETPWPAGVVPVVHFRNRVGVTAIRGRSELVNALSLQDMINRTAHSMIATSELSAFPLRVALGFVPPSTVQPGSWITITDANGQPLDGGMQVGVDTMAQASLVPFIQQLEYLVQTMSQVTRTPLPGMGAAAGASGEAMRQRESDVLAKVSAAQVRFGNAWEDVMRMAARLQATFGVRTAPGGDWNTVWASAATRNDVEVVENALKLADQVSRRELLRMVAPVYDWDEGRIDRILNERAAESAEGLAMVQRELPGFEALGLPAGDEPV